MKTVILTHDFVDVIKENLLKLQQSVVVVEPFIIFENGFKTITLYEEDFVIISTIDSMLATYLNNNQIDYRVIFNATPMGPDIDTTIRYFKKLCGDKCILSRPEYPINMIFFADFVAPRPYCDLSEAEITIKWGNEFRYVHKSTLVGEDAIIYGNCIISGETLSSDKGFFTNNSFGLSLDAAKMICDECNKINFMEEKYN